jgi:hypothetical protein
VRIEKIERVKSEECEKSEESENWRKTYQVFFWPVRFMTILKNSEESEESERVKLSVSVSGSRVQCATHACPTDQL